MQIERAEFGDIDEFSESLTGWQLDWRQLEAGALRVSATQIASAESLLSYVSFNRPFLQAGATPSGMRSFALVQQGLEPSVVAWGHRMVGSSILPFPDSYEATSTVGYSAHTIAVREDTLLELAAELDRERELRRALYMDTPIVCSPASLRALNEAANAIVFGCGEISTSSQAAAIGEELDHSLPRLLVLALTSAAPAADSVRSSASRGNRRDTAARACAFIEEHARDLPTVQGICRQIGASRRTLEYAMREHAGVSPKIYLQAARLQGVRRELARAEPDTRIADVAGAWGFWHMGQFARDYRRWFGELPSQTLASGSHR